MLSSCQQLLHLALSSTETVDAGHFVNFFFQVCRQPTRRPGLCRSTDPKKWQHATCSKSHSLAMILRLATCSMAPSQVACHREFKVRPRPVRPKHFSFVESQHLIPHRACLTSQLYGYGPAQIEFGLNLIVCCELERDTQTANFALLQIDWCGPAPCLRRLLLHFTTRVSGPI